MSCVRRAFPLVFATAMTVTGIAADTAAPAPASSPRSSDESASVASPRPAILATPATPPAEESKRGDRVRAISPTTAAQLAAAVPTFEAPPPTPIATSLADSASVVDLREVDRPRNTIVRLPSYLVQEEKPVILTEREIQTPRARLQLALKKHPGLRLGSFWIFRNDALALAMLAEEERLERKREFEDLASLMQISDPAAGATVKRDVERAFKREPDFGR